MTTTAPTTIDSKKPNTKQELIAANIKLLIEQLEAGHSDALTNYLTAMSRFHRYSFGNVLEIARQMPTATRVAGFWTWKNFGRSVKAGQKGIRILAPIVGVRSKKDEDAQKDISKQNERVLLGFRNAYVFDVSQTEGVDLPEMHHVSGNPGENLERLASFVRSRGILLAYNENIAPALGDELWRTHLHPARPVQSRRVFDAGTRDRAPFVCTRPNAAPQPLRPCARQRPRPSRLWSGRLLG